MSMAVATLSTGAAQWAVGRGRGRGSGSGRVRVEAAQTAAPTSRTPTERKPVREIPGSYGLPLLGAIADRQDFFRKGADAFFRDRVRRHGSTVLRLNMPPGPPIAADPRVVALLDAKSFPLLFDVALVDKTDVFTGTYAPQPAFTGGFRTLSFLDPSEPRHAQLKGFLFHVLRSRAAHVAPAFAEAAAAMFEQLESGIAARGRAEFNEAAEYMALEFLLRAFTGVGPAEGGLGRDTPAMIKKWVLCQLGPIMSLGLPLPVEELALRTFRLPFALVRRDYERLLTFFRTHAGEALATAEDGFGVPREEACHNLLYNVCFNTWGGTTFLFPSLLLHVGRAGPALHGDLAREVREAVAAAGGQVGPAVMAAEKAMPLLASTVWEALRVSPPVAYQYGRAKDDMLLESHDALFRVKRGEMLCGYQPFATRDPRVFDCPDQFQPRRFMEDHSKHLLRHVVWSNGPETESPSTSNKQCAGKDFVILMSRLLLAHIFLRYDSFHINSPGGSTVTVTSLIKATPAPAPAPSSASS